MTISRTVLWNIDPDWGSDMHSCEQCGGGIEEIEIETAGEIVNARASWGCYSGSSAYDLDVDGLNRFLDDLPEGFISGYTKSKLLAEVGKELADK